MNARETAKKDIEAWLDQVPDSERDVPWFVIDTPDGPKPISPAEAIEELSDADEMNFTSSKLVMKWGKGSQPLLAQLKEPDCDIVLEQVKKRTQLAEAAGHSGFLGTVDGEFFTMEQVVSHMERNTERGQQFRRMFTRLYDDFVRKLVR